MAEPPKRRADVSSAGASRVEKPVRTPGVPTSETARAADSVPAPVGPFAILPMKFGRYEVRRELGKGQMGAVYLAFDVELDRLVALKVARVSASGSAKLLKRMEIEAKSAAKVDHPLICKVYDAGEIDGIRFIALQYIEGEDLKKYMKRLGRKREPDEAVRIILQILRALEAAHEQGVIHRDLKPENVMLNKKNEPVIMDFGLARKTIASSDAGLTQGMVVGTGYYMSPEQAQGKAEAIDHRTNLYSVGVILFEMLTGDWPFTGGLIEVMGKKVVQEPPSVLALNPTLNPQLAAVCIKMIAKQRGDRYVNCAEAVAALEAVDLKAAVIPTPSIQIAESAPPIHVVEETPNFDFLKEASAVSAIRKSPANVGKKNSAVGTKKRSAQTSSFGVFGTLLAWWKALTPMLRLTMLGSAGIGLIALAVILFLPTKNGVLKIEVDDPSLLVKFDGSTITVDNDNQPIKISQTANRTLEVVYNNGPTVESFTKEIVLKKGDTRIVKVTLVDGAVAIDGQRVVADASSRPKEPETLQFDGKTAGEQRELAPGIKFRWCPEGTFFMGSPVVENGRRNNEDLVQVTLTSGFWLGETEVTQAQWKSLMQTEPWQGKQLFKEGPEYAAGYIRHGDSGNGELLVGSASEFCRRLTEQERKAERLPVGWKYALPTEAQWEYSCRAGTATKYSFGDNDESLNDYAWWGAWAGDGNAKTEQYAHLVGLKLPNAWGLRDMHGNLWEWCEDWYGENLPGGRDPSGALENWGRVYRGGCWADGATFCRSAYRGRNPPDFQAYFHGFRVAVVHSSE